MPGLVEPPAAPRTATRAPLRRPRTARDLSGFVALALGLGAASGVVWWLVVDLPHYLVGTDGRARTTERGLADLIAADAWFALIGAVLGLALGWLAWRRLGHLGWPVVPVAVAAVAAAALLCWLVGHQLGPSDFNTRLAAARPGDVVPVQLTLRARASLLVWPFAATVPVLLGASLGRDDEEPPPRVRRPRSGPSGLGRLVRRRSRPPAPPSP